MEPRAARPLPSPRTQKMSGRSSEGPAGHSGQDRGHSWLLATPSGTHPAAFVHMLLADGLPRAPTCTRTPVEGSLGSPPTAASRMLSSFPRVLCPLLAEPPSPAGGGPWQDGLRHAGATIDSSVSSARLTRTRGQCSAPHMWHGDVIFLAPAHHP